MNHDDCQHDLLGTCPKELALSMREGRRLWLARRRRLITVLVLSELFAFAIGFLFGRM